MEAGYRRYNRRMPLAGTPTRWQARPPADPALAGGALDERISVLAAKLRVPPLVARLLVLRGLDQPEEAQSFIAPKLTDLPEPDVLPGADAAAQRLAAAISERRPIVIYGDYDVDGVTASAILYHTLMALGGEGHPVATYVPHRVDEGYGLNEDALRAIAAYEAHPGLLPGDARPPLVVSVDCGVTATGPAALAKSLGVELIITDHHAFGDELPDVAVMVHPELPEGEAPSGLTPPPCGAGVAFLLAWQTARVALGTDKLPPPMQKLLVDLLPLAALGTVADLVKLRGMNRVLTLHGLARIKQTRFAGLKALIAASGLGGEDIDAYHVGFVLGPRLNACGRMGHAREAVELLTTAAGERAVELSEFLTGENDSRKATERSVADEAVAQVEAGDLATPDRRVLVLHGPDWHPGVVGIVASRLVDRYHRPVIVLTDDPAQPGVVKGSARSVPGVHIQGCLQACSEHLMRYGGHAMAAGLTLEAAQLPAFRDALIEQVNQALAEDDLIRTVRYDTAASESDLNARSFGELQRLAPFGQGNPTPKLRFDGARLERPPRRVGGNGRHLALQLRCGAASLKAIAFGRGDDADVIAVGDQIDVVFEPKLNTWNGVTRPEMVVVDLALPGESI